MEDSKRAWITGAGGLIGHWLERVAPIIAPHLQVTPLTRPLLDLADFDALTRRFQQDRPSIVIHCAALSRSPDCQADPALARLLNVEVTRRLAGLAPDCRLVFFSSDLVFDGKQGNYVETDIPNPLSVYAETKLEAEGVVLQHPHHIVVRTSLNGGQSPTRDRGFNEQMRRAWQAGQSLRLFWDEFRSPIHAEFTARAVWELTLRGTPGLYHVAGAERLSRWDIGQLLAARWPALKPKIERTSLAEYTGAPRAPDTSLDCAKAQQVLSFPLPRFSQWLATQPAEAF